MKLIQFLVTMREHAFMYNGKCYVLLNIPYMARKANLTEKTVRDFINSLIHNYSLLRMNFDHPFYTGEDNGSWTLYQIVLPKELKEIEDNEELHWTTISEIKQEINFRDSH